jgi:hypothetical protein
VAIDRSYIEEDHSIVERRRLTRTKILHPGKILAQEETVYSCVVHNLTGIGACIELDPKIEQLPAAIAFSFDNFRTIHACKIIWREGHFAGIEFENRPELPQRRDVSRDAKLILAKALQRA